MIKSFEELKVDKEELIKRFSSSTIDMQSNSDGESLLYAASILAERPEKRKLLIVLSDGSPAHRGGDAAYLKKVVGMLEGSKGISLVALGILDSAVKDFYKNYRIVNRIEDLEPELLEVLKENLLEKGA